MSTDAVSNFQPEFDPLNAAEQAISACDGDLHDTVRALIVANRLLQSELRRPLKATSVENEMTAPAKIGDDVWRLDLRLLSDLGLVDLRRVCD